MNKRGQQKSNRKLPAANTGNASNPSPHDNKMEPVGSNQLLNDKAEKYLRESANIEDEPDAQDQQDANEIIEEENLKINRMRQNTSNKKQISNNSKDRKGDTSRTSNQGRKAASGGNTNTNNKGVRKGM
jgi:hypothetical protein